MTIKYKLVKTSTPGVTGGGAYKYYARACERKKAGINEIADVLSKRSSLSKSDIVATLIGLEDIIPELLLDNHTVELGDLGTFSLHLKSEGSDVPRVDAYRLIKDVKIHFLPGKELKRSVRSPEFQKSKLNEY